MKSSFLACALLSACLTTPSFAAVRHQQTYVQPDPVDQMSEKYKACKNMIDTKYSPQTDVTDEYEMFMVDACMRGGGAY